MTETREIRAGAFYARAIEAVDDLLSRLRLSHAFVGSVAASVWAGREVESGSVDVLAVTSPDQQAQIPMMASNHGFQVDEARVESARELDLVPLGFPSPEGTIRVHVLLATNALYAKMFGRLADASLGDRTVQVIGAEDFALLLSMAQDPESARLREEVARNGGEDFDVERFNRTLETIGIGGKAIIR
ncbi:MAG: hypothetical protein WBX15_06945 [Thermoanaerobaculia bacterium]